jgi:hypothetical protein
MSSKSSARCSSSPTRRSMDRPQSSATAMASD